MRGYAPVRALILPILRTRFLSSRAYQDFYVISGVMDKDKRGAPRVNFERGVTVRILAIDGTWQRECDMLDVSESGVLLRVIGSLAGLDLKEFFLVLSSRGTAHRRCSLAWVEGERIGASFVKDKIEKKKNAFKRI